jgi:hypothetical protein
MRPCAGRRAGLFGILRGGNLLFASIASEMQFNERLNDFTDGRVEHSGVVCDRLARRFC